MKKTLTTALLTLAATTSSMLAGPSWGFTLGDGSGFYYGNPNQRCETRVYQASRARHNHVNVMPLPSNRGNYNSRSYDPIGVDRVYVRTSDGAVAVRTNDGRVWIK